MRLEYRWIINVSEISGRIDRGNTARRNKVYQDFIERSFRRGYIDANELSHILFPKVAHSDKKQIFISHPHSCSAAARQIKDLLSDKYYCFLDVDVWEQVDSILTSLQIKNNSADSLSLVQCNKWAAHLYLLLSQAILREIARSHIVLYIESGKEDSEIIHSPWLYFELSAVESIGSTNLNLLKEANFSSMTMTDINYNIKDLTKNYLRIRAHDLKKLPNSSPEEINEEAILRSCINRHR